jgi:phage FluMu gp28-like protein
MNVSPVAEAVNEALLMPFQTEFNNDPSPVRIWEKSRRIGASWGFSSEAVLTASAESNAGGMDCWYIGYNQDMAKEFIRDAADWARSIQLAVDEIDLDGELFVDDNKDILTYCIRFASGFRITALSSRPSNLRGKQGLIIIDEAAFHDDLAGLIKAAMAMLIWGGRVVVISTHNGEDNPFNIVIKDSRAGKLPYKVFSTPFMSAIGQGLYKRICRMKGVEWTQALEDKFVEDTYDFYGDDASEELDGIPSQGSGQYISRVLVERVQSPRCEVVRITRKDEFVTDPNRLADIKKWCDDNLKPLLDNLPGLRSVFGQDFGRSGDLSTINIMQKESPTFWHTPFIVELRNIPFDCQQFIMFYIIDALPLFSHGKFDARGNGQAHAESALQRYGERYIDCVMFSRPWYAEHFPKYKAALEGKNLDLPVSEDIVADHRRVVLDKGTPRMDDKHDKGSDGGQRHGDTAISGVLAWAATEEEGEPAAGAGPSDVAPDDIEQVYRSTRESVKQRIRLRASMN